MINISKEMRVGDIAVRNTALRKIFEQYGIDFCCKGEQPLDTAAAKKGIPIKELLNRLNEAANIPNDSGSKEKNWAAVQLSELIDYIVSHHHGYLKENLPMIQQLIEKVLNAHAQNHAVMLTTVQQTFGELYREIDQHLQKEESILFPLVKSMESYNDHGGDKPQSSCGSVKSIISQMKTEHESAGNALEKLRLTTSDYTLPQDACASFSGLFQDLQQLEKDLHEHINLENNLLFSKSIDLENSLFK